MRERERERKRERSVRVCVREREIINTNGLINIEAAKVELEIKTFFNRETNNLFTQTHQ